MFADLVRTEGVQGLFKGLSVNYFKARRVASAACFCRFRTRAPGASRQAYAAGRDGPAPLLPPRPLQAPVAMGISFSVYHHVKEMLDASDW